jgi:hypothetical protein
VIRDILATAVIMVDIRIKLLRANGANKGNNLMHAIWVPSDSQRSEQYGSCDQGTIRCQQHRM